MRAGGRGWLLALQQDDESALISVGSKKHHERITRARQTRLNTKKPELTQEEENRGARTTVKDGSQSQVSISTV